MDSSSAAPFALDAFKLAYTSETLPGIRRQRRGKGFAYFLPDGSLLTDEKELQRIASLVIPPAYKDVWICRVKNGHLQATGIDQRGRKQYRYHPLWHELANDRKFSNLPAFVSALPRIRSRVKEALKEEGMTRSRVIAGVVALLDQTGYRIGNEKYVKDNRSFGLASLLMKHLKQEDGEWVMRFKGKAGTLHEAEVKDPQLTSLLEELQDLPGQHLFRYEDDAGVCHDITTADVNAWMKEAGGGEFTAKQFRTWKATLICAKELSKTPPDESTAAIRRAIRQAVVATAAHLRHTPTTCRKYYLPPRLFTAYQTGRLFTGMSEPAASIRGFSGLHMDERRLLPLIMEKKRRNAAPRAQRSKRKDAA